MILLSIDNLRKYFGQVAILEGVTFDVRPGERIGLVGPNGSGKSTLMKIIAGQLEADGGTVQQHPSSKAGYLEQQPEFAEGETLWDVAHSAMQPLIDLATKAEKLADQLAAAEDHEQRTLLGEQFDQVQQELHRRDGYHLDHRVERVLDGLGFARAAYDQLAASLSGGEQNRLLLGRLLLTSPDLLLLDEPSNHLDVAATQWLEEFLSASSQAILLVSHDRFLLDRVTTRTLELHHGRTESYTGNFSAYWHQKEERLQVQQRTYQKQQEEIAKLEDFVRRHHHGLKHAQAEDRRKKLERIEPVPPPREIHAPPMGFPPASRSGDIVIRADHLRKSFDDKLLFQEVSLQVQRGERWGILGPNGSGKTTLLRCLLNELAVDEGTIDHGAGVHLGYFDQQLAGLAEDALVVDAIRPAHKEFTEPERRNQLARFGLTGDQAFQRVSQLSGGERNRTALARLAASDANVLVLDEPTNHLDLWARDALERSLTQFEGTVLFVSHDRFFINQVADHLIILEPGKVRVVEGDYDLYLRLRTQWAEADSAAAAKGNTTTKRRSSAEAKPSKRPKRRFPYRKVVDIEADIFTQESRIEEIHTLLAEETVLRDGEQVKSLQNELTEVHDSLATLYEHWEEASELN